MVNRLLIVAESTINRREPEIGTRVIRIQSDGLFIGAPCVLPLEQPRISVTDLNVDAGNLRIHGLGGEQGVQRAAKIAAGEFDSRPQ